LTKDYQVSKIEKDYLIRGMKLMGERFLPGRIGSSLLAILWLFTIISVGIGWKRPAVASQSEDFKYLEGTLVKLIGKVLVVKSDDGKKTNFRVGWKTVFVPDAWPKIGDRLRVKYHTRVLSHKAIGNYFIGYEVTKIGYTADVSPKTAVPSVASQSEDFKSLEGTLVHLQKKILVVKADDGEKTNFRVGRKTVFTPKAWPKIGDRLRVKYHTRLLWHKAIGNYFIGYEVTKVDRVAEVSPKIAVPSPEIQKKKTLIPDSQREHPEPSLEAPSWQRHHVSQHWAVIVGVSDYHDSRIPSLRYAAADAQSFYNWLTSPDGGRYPPSRIKLLVNEQATGSNIKEALFVWLKQAIAEDMVIIFFAGHGSPDSPDTPENLFLLPCDAHYDNIATTGFPMWDIETALRRFIKAKKVVVIADACHAGGVGQSFDVARRADRGIKINRISSGLQNLSGIGDGVAVISAADDRQFSQEGEKWGGGHGVFTHFLLKGLKGEADYNEDKRVSLGELVPFLSEQVRRATMNAQSPIIAGKFDPALSIGR
jgi:hypothetical protein